MDIREYINAAGRAPFARWFDQLEADAAAKVSIALTRMQQGNFADSAGIGAGVFEYRIHYGPGYRIYFGKDGDSLVILLGGGTKKRQQNDIENAKILWGDYKRQKKQEV